MVSKFIFLRSWVMEKSGQSGKTAYMLDEDNGGLDADDLIAASTSAKAGSLVVVADKKGNVTIPGMKKKRFIGADVLWGAV